MGALLSSLIGGGVTGIIFGLGRKVRKKMQYFIVDQHSMKNIAFRIYDL